MRKNSLTIALIFASCLLMSCQQATSKAVQSQMTVEVAKPLASIQEKTILTQSGGKVDFKGVSFSYNPQIFGAVKMEEVAEQILENKDDKPDYVEPQHHLFTFDSSTEYSEMYLAVYPVEDFPRMYAVNKESAEYMKQEINNLKKVLKDKNFRVEDRIPYLRFYDASNSFYAKVKHFSFQSGEGILFLTHYGIGIEIVSNHNLTNVFEGLTTDKKHYVLAEISVSVDFLPKEQTDEFEGYKIPWDKLSNKAEMKKLDNVKQKIGKRLENLPQNKFDPNLKYFEEIISSLKIEK